MLQHLPPELLVYLVSMLPLIELQGGIPLGLFLNLPLEAAFFWGVCGTMTAVIIILKLLGPVSNFLIKHFNFFKNFFHKLFNITRHKHSQKFEEIGAIFLVSFVAIPLPGAGAWSGALIAFLFDIPFWKALGLILLGNLIAAILVSLGIGSALEIAKIFIK